MFYNSGAHESGEMEQEARMIAWQYREMEMPGYITDIVAMTIMQDVHLPLTWRRWELVQADDSI